MQTKEIKKLICEIGRRMFEKDFVASNDGNISYRMSNDEIWVTPSGVSKGYMTPEMLVRVNIDGMILEGSNQPSSEVKMHLSVYNARPDIHAVVHAHPPVATAFAVCRKGLEKKYLTEAIVGLGDIHVAEYATPSTDRVHQSIEPYLKENEAVLLANHGALTWDDTLEGAYYKLETLEAVAKIHMHVGQIGVGVELDPEEVEKLIGLRTFYKEQAAKK